MPDAVSLKQGSSSTMHRMVYDYLVREDNGADHNANIDASVTPVRFVYRAPPTGALQLTEFIVFMGSTGIPAAGNYAATARLDTGVGLTMEDAEGNTAFDLLHGFWIRENAGWRISCERYVAEANASGPGVCLVAGIMDLTRHDIPMRLVAGEKLVVTLRDDFTGLAGHYFGIRGFRT
jgi:hypothetical protein